MKFNLKKISVLISLVALASCSEQSDKNKTSLPETPAAPVAETSKATAKEINYPTQGKPVIYQVFTRLFGNKNTTNRAWGTLEQNGVGKFNDFTDEALKGIKEFGVSHVWYTGVPHHAVITDYSEFGISHDDPDVVKGRAGSPYAVKDYYNVNPDLAVNPANRLEEFKSLIERTHKNGMKVIIDIVPNHVARNYHSISKPEGVSDFGEHDDTNVEYKRNNNFYYIPGKAFEVPKFLENYRPLNGESNPLSDEKFDEFPAKWTGNGARKIQPDANDWYETVKINYGVRPDGSFDFPRLPKELATQDYQAHYKFWKGRDVPDSWKKFKDITTYWINNGVDGFRYDMAEMVPVEFWSYLNSSIKQLNPDATLVAEVYNPTLYRDYIQLGKMDYLYDKVDFYDTLKAVMQQKAPTSKLLPIVETYKDIDTNLLHFLENHDEQRIASSGFAGDARIGQPAMVVSSLIGKGPNLLYYAQALGEAGLGDAGFGDPTRTTIFDYWGVASLQRWMNDGKFDGGKSTQAEKELRAFYVNLMKASATLSSLNGDFQELHSHNLKTSKGYDESLFSFARWDASERVFVASNFSPVKEYQLNLEIPKGLLEQLKVSSMRIPLDDALSLKKGSSELLVAENGIGTIKLTLKPLESKVLRFTK